MLSKDFPMTENLPPEPAGEPVQKPVTDAAMSVHRFEMPLKPTDVYRALAITRGDVDLAMFKDQATQHGDKRAKEASKRYAVPDAGTLTEVERVHALAERILGLLSMSRYRRGPIQFVQEGKPVFLQKISDAILQEKPVELIMSFYGLKVQNPLKTYGTDGSEVDVSEMASLLRFYEITQAIGKMYGPGAEFHIACDGRKYAEALGYTNAQASGYYRNLNALCAALGIQQSVHLPDEADFYPEDHQERTATHLHRIRTAYAQNDPAVTGFVTKLRASMCLSMPVNTGEIDVEQLRFAFSAMTDTELCAHCPAALEVRRHLLDRSLDCTLKYVAVYDAVKEAGVLEQIAPAAVRATVHPKPGQIGLYAVNERTNDVFPHHGQGVVQTGGAGMTIDNVRVRFRADLERQDPQFCAICLPKDRYPFSDEQHPFLIAPNV